MPVATINLEYINSLDHDQAEEVFFQCSGSKLWAQLMADVYPFYSQDQIKNQSEIAWRKLNHPDWLDAFAAHPKIGDRESLREKFASTAHLAANEQSGVNDADEETLEHLATGNALYEEKFGYIFIVCATGKTASEMLMVLQIRLTNDPDREFVVTCSEQRKITQLRLEKLGT